MVVNGDGVNVNVKVKMMVCVWLCELSMNVIFLFSSTEQLSLNALAFVLLFGLIKCEKINKNEQNNKRGPKNGNEHN